MSKAELERAEEDKIMTYDDFKYYYSGFEKEMEDTQNELFKHLVSSCKGDHDHANLDEISEDSDVDETSSFGTDLSGSIMYDEGEA